MGPDTVRRLLRTEGFVLRANRKRLDQRQDAERDHQMRYVAWRRRAFVRAGFPVISVDTKQRELVGNFKNPGRTWRRKPLEVSTSDYPSDAKGVAIPYGIYDVGRNEGYVVVGTSHQTPQFAIAAIRRWWRVRGRRLYGRKRHILIEADSGGANGYRNGMWHVGLQHLADEFGLTITVTHLPTSASKWNPIEHRMFCHIEANWAGQPLADLETVLKFIRTTTTETGFRCRARLDKSDYPTGLKPTATELASINIKRHARPYWNYTISPRRRST